MNDVGSNLAAEPFASLDHTGRLPVDPSVINNALNELWESSLSGESPERSYSRVSLYDLIVVADATTLQRAEALIQNFARERPSRTIFVCIDNESDAQEQDRALFAEVGIACGMIGAHHGSLCWERITLFTSGASLRLIPSAVQSLLSGVNRIVFVDLAPSIEGRDALAELYRLADWVFFDSQVNRRKLAAKVDAEDGDFHKLFDIGYERDHPLREAIKRAFDEPDVLAATGRIGRIELGCCHSGESTRTRELYLTGWLAVKLRLRLVRTVSRREWECVTDAGRSVYIELCDRESADGDASHAGLFDVRFVFDGAPTELVVAPLAPGPQDTQADGRIRRSYTIQIDGSSRCVFNSAELHEADYILRRLSDSHRRSDYRASLSQALRLIGNARGGRPYRGLRRFPEAESLAHNAAEYFVSVMRDAVIQRGRFSVALAGGSTPIALYRLLSGSVFASCSEWRDTTFLFGDERTVPPSHADSNYRTARENLFDPLGIDAESVLRLTGESDDLSEAAEEYEREVRRRVPQRNAAGDSVLDLVLLGLGDDGHTASIFPDYPEREIGPEALVGAVYVASKKTNRLTLTPRLINAARTVVFLVSGAAKAEALRNTLINGSSAAARIAPESGRLLFFVDEAAAAQLEPAELGLNVERW